MSILALLIAIWLGIIAWRRRQIAIPHWQPLAWASAFGLVVSATLLLLDLESQKLAARLLSPLGLVWLILLGLALESLRARAWPRLGLLGGTWLLLSVGGNAWVGAWMLGRLEAGVPAPQPAVRWDAACVLGGGTMLTPDGTPGLGPGGDRLSIAAGLWRERRVPVLVTTGSGLLGSEHDRDLAAETAVIWARWGIPADAIVRRPGPVNTDQEIAALATLVHERGWRRVAIVTSGWHLPRALALARRYGLPADGVAADSRGRLPPASPVFLVPCGSGAEDVALALHEIAGRLFGR